MAGQPPVNTDALLPLVVQHVPGCPDELVRQQLRETWRDFCQRSEWWRPKIDVDLVAGQLDYALQLPGSAHIRRVVAVWVRTLADVDADRDGTLMNRSLWSVEERTGENLLRLRNDLRRSQTSGLRVQPILVPSMFTQEPPDVAVLERWGDALAAGAAAALALMPRRKWTNVTTASARGAEYSRAIAKARRENLVGLQSDTHFQGE